MKRWKVEYRSTSGWGLGPTTWATPTYHRTFFGADWHRRFRHRYFSFGTIQITSIPSRAKDNLPQDEPSPFPRYSRLLETIWKPVYFLRNRWDGLRYGRDRDKF